MVSTRLRQVSQLIIVRSQVGHISTVKAPWTRVNGPSALPQNPAAVQRASPTEANKRSGQAGMPWRRGYGCLASDVVCEPPGLL